MSITGIVLLDNLLTLTLGIAGVTAGLTVGVFVGALVFCICYDVWQSFNNKA